MALTVLTASWVRVTASDDAGEQFRQSATQAANGVRGELDKYFMSLDDIGALMASVPGTTPSQFNDYVRNARIFERLPSVVGILYLARVSEEDNEAFLARARAADPSFQPLSITTDGPTWPKYYLMQYAPGKLDLPLPVGAEISPIKAITDLLVVSAERGEGVVGSFQHDPVLQSIATQNPGVVPLQKLLAIDFFIGVPVYESTAAGPGKGKLLGWTAAPVAKFNEVVEQAAKGTPQGLGMSLTVDLTDAGMGQRQDLSRVAQQVGTAGERDQAAFVQEDTFEMDGVAFRLAVWSTPDADDPPAAYLILLLGGLVAAVMAAGVTYLRLRAHEREMVFADELADHALFQREIVDSVTNAMVVLDADGSIVVANPAWSELLGTAPSSGDGGRPHHLSAAYLDLMNPRLRGGSEQLAAGIHRVLAGEEGSVELDVPLEVGRLRRWYSVRGTPLRGVHGGAVIVHTDITERKRSHDELEFKASRDDLTGLLNRASLETEIDDALRRARTDGTSAGVLFIDLDGFKAINDTHGHAVGDEVLRSMSTRISTAVRTSDRVARLGGDEFVVLIAPLSSPEVAHRTADRILRSFRDPIHVGGQMLRVEASIGVTVVDSPLDVSGTDLIERADEAMYRAKQSGGAHYEVN